MNLKNPQTSAILLLLFRNPSQWNRGTIRGGASGCWKFEGTQVNGEGKTRRFKVWVGSDAAGRQKGKRKKDPRVVRTRRMGRSKLSPGLILAPGRSEVLQGGKESGRGGVDLSLTTDVVRRRGLLSMTRGRSGRLCCLMRRCAVSWRKLTLGPACLLVAKSLGGEFSWTSVL